MSYFHDQSADDQFPKTEVQFFNLIKKYVSIVFDVGARDDIDYIKNSYDASRQFHLFEPVPEFVSNCQKQIENLEPSEDINNEIFLNPFGIGSENGVMDYYPNTQSFVFRTHGTNSVSAGLSFPIKTLDEYCQENKVNNIDFLKIDIEGMEIDVLNGGKDIIQNNTKIIQFEYGLCILDRQIDPDHLVGWFDKDKFDLFFQGDPRHPYYEKTKKLLTPLTEEVYQDVKTDMINGAGCNLVAIRKEISNEIYNSSLEQ